MNGGEEEGKRERERERERREGVERDEKRRKRKEWIGPSAWGRDGQSEAVGCRPRLV